MSILSNPRAPYFTHMPQPALPEVQLLTVTDMALLFRTSKRAIQVAVQRLRHTGRDPGFPPPMLIRGRHYWLAREVKEHLERAPRATKALPAEGGEAQKLTL